MRLWKALQNNVNYTHNIAYTSRYEVYNQISHHPYMQYNLSNECISRIIQKNDKMTSKLFYLLPRSQPVEVEVCEAQGSVESRYSVGHHHNGVLAQDRKSNHTE